ncbi:hypothetical protein [Acetohalobium arabaticum]|uniref:Uracil-DNA glycosylase-like domain-containing protein n=1 Tax=Acetohalobium arabaticum (strain ATCC 49924 / DSM 5501 / Z-7288) TaxID=574087 RepID=D9QQP2_ACEAZ|nr:hypothetical protein [Acetohalobium arabaticum]ADL12833.1 hypothetical protein Acear_1320 [Acetohalobium arabaticum DSM 5501]
MDDITMLAEKYLENYSVNDVINQEAAFLFILESPHTQEMRNGYPVAGSSGVEMTKFIYNTDKKDAFGKLVSQTKKYSDEYENLERFSILNVSSAPMQREGLKDYDLDEEEERIVRILEKLRVNYKSRNHRNQEWNQVKEVILSDFKQRLVSGLEVMERLTYLVPCGKLAVNYLQLIQNSEKIINQKEVIWNIPHPSFNQWSHYESMDQLKEKL